jgi:hypothetical protein
MHYELAKELKDAGFPQKHHYDEQGRRNDFCEPEVVSNPTLEELIEACGEDFGNLSFQVPTNDPSASHWWSAKSHGLHDIVPDEWSDEYKKERKDSPEHACLLRFRKYPRRGSSPSHFMQTLEQVLQTDDRKRC